MTDQQRENNLEYFRRLPHIVGLGDLLWHGGDVLRQLHSPVATMRDMVQSRKFGPKLLALVQEFLKEER